MKDLKDAKKHALIFIDVSIIQSFYEIKNHSVFIEFLNRIEECKHIIISTYQVEMEYKKNRKKIISEMFSKIKNSETDSNSFPSVLQEIKNIQEKKQKDKILQKNSYLEIEKLLDEPHLYDFVYKTFQKIFDSGSAFNMREYDEETQMIENLSKKKFRMGYPPGNIMKQTIADAVNWEWFLECMEISGRHAILVTRNKEYGTILSDKFYINDWLLEEFKRKAGDSRKILLTNKLTTAFELLNIPVTNEMLKEESRLDLSLF